MLHPYLFSHLSEVREIEVFAVTYYFKIFMILLAPSLVWRPKIDSLHTVVCKESIPKLGPILGRVTAASHLSGTKYEIIY